MRSKIQTTAKILTGIQAVEDLASGIIYGGKSIGNLAIQAPFRVIANPALNILDGKANAIPATLKEAGNTAVSFGKNLGNSLYYLGFGAVEAVIPVSLVYYGSLHFYNKDLFKMAAPYVAQVPGYLNSGLSTASDFFLANINNIFTSFSLVNQQVFQLLETNFNLKGLASSIFGYDYAGAFKYVLNTLQQQNKVEINPTNLLNNSVSIGAGLFTGTYMLGNARETMKLYDQLYAAREKNNINNSFSHSMQKYSLSGLEAVVGCINFVHAIVPVTPFSSLLVIGSTAVTQALHMYVRSEIKSSINDINKATEKGIEVYQKASLKAAIDTTQAKWTETLRKSELGLSI
jgi:hypothetical protein